MKKILTLLVVVCMLVSLVPTVISAEAENNVSVPTATTTLYVKSGLADYSNADGTEANPYQYFMDAYTYLVTAEKGGVIVLGNDVLFSSNTIRKGMVPRMNLPKHPKTHPSSVR